MKKRTAFRLNYAELAFNYFSLGATDGQLMGFLRIDGETLAAWQEAHPEFALAIRRGKLMADAEVAKSLYRIALGYELNGRHYPPDLHACAHWLANRRPDLWKALQDDGGDAAGQRCH